MYATSFVYGGVSSDELGLYIASINDKQVISQSSLGAELEIHEEFIPGRIRSLFYGVTENEPLEFSLNLAATDVFDRYHLEAIASRLAGTQEYKWLEIDQPDLRDVRFRCILNDFEVTYLAGEPLGLSCTAHCDSPYAWEFPREFSVTVGETGVATLNIYNTSSSNRVYEPKMEIYIPAGNVDVQIVNTNDKNRLFQLYSEVPIGSEVTFDIDNDRRIIDSIGTSVVQDAYTYLTHNGYKFFRLVKGMNKLNITAPAGTIVTVKCEFPKRVGG